MKAFLAAYQCLDNIFRGGAFSGIELNAALNAADKADRPLITKLVYGVLDKNIELEYNLGLFADKIKPSLSPLLKIGAYALEYLAMPPYAVINECVETAKALGKGGLSGFVNGTLRNLDRALQSKNITLPKQFDKMLSVRYSFPLWAVKKLLKQYGNDFTQSFLSYEPPKETHLRINTAKISPEDFKKLLGEKNIPYSPSPFPDGVYVSGAPEDIASPLFTPQSPGSMLVALALGATDGASVLDLCAAPGGKSAYIAAMNPNSAVLALDLHPHRVELIKSYARRMGVENITARAGDATVFDPSLEGAFDFVLVDAPCSGFGVFHSKPDIKFFRKETDIAELADLQKQILLNAAKYVKKGGALLYATCTLFDEENAAVVKHLLGAREDFGLEKFALPAAGETDGQIQLFPHIHKIEGYYIAKLKRKL